MYIFSAIFLFLSMDDTIVMATTQFKVLFNGEKVSLVKKDEKKKNHPIFIFKRYQQIENHSIWRKVFLRLSHIFFYMLHFPS